MRRVVITGMGTVNPLGKNVEEFWENIKANNVGTLIYKQFESGNVGDGIASVVGTVAALYNLGNAPVANKAASASFSDPLAPATKVDYVIKTV